MKTRKTLLYVLALMLGTGLSSCEDFLDREPLSQISPEIYFTDATQLERYVDGLYADILPSHGGKWSYGIYGEDEDTDNQAGTTAHNRYADGLWKVPNSDDSDWNFEWIYRCNYFLSTVLEKYGDDIEGSQNTITGDLASTKHYIGEVYFLRACEYFNRYKKFGDFPIVTTPLNDDMAELRAANRRMPRTEVARFILDDLDKAYTLLSAKNMATTRINKDAALLLKSRVALFEGTWLKYFKGTAFVPGGEGWPGASKDYNADYTFQSGSIDNEIAWFLDQAMESSKVIAEAYKDKLTENTGTLQQSPDEQPNPYYEMYADEDLSSYSEVLLWRQYARDLEMNTVALYAGRGNGAIGVTRAYVNNFLMADGTPVYTHTNNYADGNGYYMGDKTIADVRKNRDPRLTIFLKEPGQKNILYENPEGTEAQMVEPYPLITSGDIQRAYCTGYALRKGGSFDQIHYGNGTSFTAAICYRATEALLNYIEASYERKETLDATAEEYWKIIRRRAGVSDDLQKTVTLTNIDEEAKNDWGAYSAGKKLTDPWLYNIRRERRCEMLAEGLRYMDLCRWRSMEQMMSNPYIVEGFHLWNTEMEYWYDDDEGNTTLIADGSTKANVSPKDQSEYLRPYQKNVKQTCYNGYTWHMAHYLTPIVIDQFLITAPDGKTVTDSPLYQNPYWPTVADMPAEK